MCFVLEKFLGFLFEVRYNSKITHINMLKLKVLLSAMVTIVVTLCIVGKG